MWNNLSRVLFVFGLAMTGVAAYLYWGYGAQLRQQNRAVAEKNQELSMENDRLRENVIYLTSRLDNVVAKISKEKEDEIAKVRNTRDEMIKSLQGEVAQGQVKITQLADRLSVNIVDKILFPSGKAEISEQGRKVLKRVGAVLAKVKDKTIRIEGHTDNVPTGPPLKGRFPTNWELSTARATNVVRFLQDSAGVNPKVMEAVGMGQYHPIASNKTAAGRSQNRRIEIVLFPRFGALVGSLRQSGKGSGGNAPANSAPAATPAKGAAGKTGASNPDNPAAKGNNDKGPARSSAQGANPTASVS
ncbi:MAG: OmpA family protein [Acidiferrobacterales bacterium]